MKIKPHKFLAIIYFFIVIFLSGCCSSAAKVSHWSGCGIRIYPWGISIMDGIETRAESGVEYVED